MDATTNVLSFLPDWMKLIVSILFVITIFVPLFIKRIISPFLLFISNKIINKNRSRLCSIIKSDNLNSDISTECNNEISMLDRMKLVESNNRLIGLYFYELVKLSKHLIYFNQFKKLYPFLELTHDGIIVNHKKITKYKIIYYIYSGVLFSFMVYFAFSLFFHYLKMVSSNDFDIFIMSHLFMIGFSEILGLLFLGKIVKKNELTKFYRINNIYREEIMENLKAEFKNITDL